MRSNLDGLTVILALPAKVRPETVVFKLFHASKALDMDVDISWLPDSITTALKTACTRAQSRTWLDKLWPPRLHRHFQTVSNHLVAASTINKAEGVDRNSLIAGKQLGLPKISVGPCTAVLRLNTQLPFGSKYSYVELVFDWRAFHLTAEGALTVSTAVVRLCQHLRAVTALGGDSHFWRQLEEDYSGDPFAHPVRSGAPLVSSRANRLRDTALVESARVGDYFAGWYFPNAGEPTEAISTIVDRQPRSVFKAHWTGCSGKFNDIKSGHDNAESHYQKHVHHQREWNENDMPSVSEYVTEATKLLDDLTVFEMRQPTNHAVVKYDLERDVLAIGKCNSGNILTLFRPGGAGYVLRKLESHQWHPPPIEGFVPYDPSPEPDSDLDILLRIWSTRLDEAVVVTLSCLADVSSSGFSGSLLEALASQTRLEYVFYRLHQYYLTDEEETRLDACADAMAEPIAALELVLNHLRPDATNAIYDAIEKAISIIAENITFVLDAESTEALTDLFDLRDLLGYVQLALRSHSWICPFIRTDKIDALWFDLAALDTLLLVNQFRFPTTPQPASDWPDGFFWRGREPS